MDHAGLEEGEALESSWRSLARRIAVIVPVLNEEELIAGVVTRLLQQGVGWVVVVDNGSTDRSAEAASDAGAEVVFEGRTGYGMACWAGMKQLPEGAEYVLFAAGDGQDDAAGLRSLIQVSAAAGSGAAPQRSSLLLSSYPATYSFAFCFSADCSIQNFHRFFLSSFPA